MIPALSAMNATSGAEATVRETVFLGREAIEKTRPPKQYRLSEIDSRIRRTRTKTEARVLHEARAAGVRTPCVYDVDTEGCRIVMEKIEGPTVKDCLKRHPEDAPRICRLVGNTVGRLHRAGISHGDLTTSNMILRGDELCIIDFSMSKTRAEIEDLGIDLRLLERGFASAHPDIPDAFVTIMEGYREITDSDAAEKRLNEIRNRGRYT